MFPLLSVTAAATPPVEVTFAGEGTTVKAPPNWPHDIVSFVPVPFQSVTAALAPVENAEVAARRHARTDLRIRITPLNAGKRSRALLGLHAIPTHLLNMR